MTLERRNPLPVGRYWIDIFESGATAWQTWLAQNAGTVKVESTQNFASPGIFEQALEHPLDPLGFWLGKRPARQFNVFAVAAPTPWPPNMGIGHPTVAAGNVTQSDDTATKPPPPTDLVASVTEGAESLGALASTATKVTIGLAVVVVAAIGYKVLKG